MALVCFVSCAGCQSSSSSLSLKEMPAGEVMAMVDNSSVAIDRVLITGDFTLENDKNYPLQITNSVFAGNVSCKGLSFFGNVNFENTTFSKDAIFNGSRFMLEANFNSSRFAGIASFNQSRFPDGVTFDFVDFGGLADFANIQFDSFATFYNATFRNQALFSFSEFDGSYANFETAQFLGDVDFAGCQFNTYCTFAGARLEKSADFHATRYSSGGIFMGTQFLGYANFARSHFVEDSFFNGVLFNDMASFLNAKFDGPASLNDSIFCKNANFDNAQFLASTDMSRSVFKGDIKMNNTKIARMVFGGSDFKMASHLYLANADISRMIVDWSEIQGVVFYDNSAYLALIKNYKDLGRSNDANDCYYEYRYLNQAHKPVGFSKFLDVVAWLSCGYGVRPHYALFCGVVVILLFSFIYMIGRGVEGFSNIHGFELMVSSLYYSTIAFTANSKGLPLRRHYKYLGIAEGIIGWLLMALFLVTLGKLIIG